MAKSELTGIGSWRLIEALGAGERAIVYRATSASALGANARPMAVKVLHGVLAQDAAAAAAFVERAKCQLQLTRLEHPTIVPCHAVEEAGGRPYAVLELVDAVSLDRLFPERGRPKFSLEAATNLIVAVLDALAAAANEKIVHGRLGPSDVLVQPDGTVALSSFGTLGDLRMDFLAVHRLAQSLNAPWLPEVDGWLDALAAEKSTWKDARGARAAFPLAFTEAGQKSLERAVRTRRKKEQKLAAEIAEARDATARVEVDDEPTDAAEVGVGSARRRSPQASKTTNTRVSKVQTPMSVRRETARDALGQARVVAFSALVIVVVALAVEVFGFAR